MPDFFGVSVKNRALAKSPPSAHYNPATGIKTIGKNHETSKLVAFFPLAERNVLIYVYGAIGPDGYLTGRIVIWLMPNQPPVKMIFL